VIERALAELRAGAKRGHWMWFVFPQLAGLGSSPTSRRYAIAGPQEAHAYLEDPVLGPRLVSCCEALLGLPADASAEHVLGSVDALKLRSCATLFAQAAPGQPVFERVLARFYAGDPDPVTVRLLATESGRDG
jgi:uncharacterized protein (DUF1810 family)